MEYLYHYTNIETLALILSNRTIRLNRLDKVDDLQEKASKELPEIGKLVFVSSWTDDDKESIPMWKMYGSLDAGVRIKLRKYPFEEKELDVAEIQSAAGMPVVVEEGSSLPKTLVSVPDMIKRKYSVQGLVRQQSILYKVEYTDDESLLYPSIISKDSESVNIAIGKIGKYKNTHWDFQREWRYIMQVYPIDAFDIENHEKSIITFQNELLTGTLEPHIENYDLKINKDAFEEMSITMSPKLSAGNKVILENLVEKYNPTASIRNSTLLGLL